METGTIELQIPSLTSRPLIRIYRLGINFG